MHRVLVGALIRRGEDGSKAAQLAPGSWLAGRDMTAAPALPLPILQECHLIRILQNNVLIRPCALSFPLLASGRRASANLLSPFSDWFLFVVVVVVVCFILGDAAGRLVRGEDVPVGALQRRGFSGRQLYSHRRH